MSWSVDVGSESFEISVKSADSGRFVLVVDGEEVELDACFPEVGALHMIWGGQAYEIDVQKTEAGRDVTVGGTRYSARLLDERSRALQALGMGGAAGQGDLTISTSMPGKVVAILVDEGQPVSAGDGVIVVEAMKMENELKAAADAVVEGICVKVGDAVEGGTVLVKLAAREDA